MSKEIILRKVDNQFIGIIPQLGLMVKSHSAEEVYSELNRKSQQVEEEWSKSGFGDFLRVEDPYIKVVKLEKSFKRFTLTMLVAYFLGLVALGLVIVNSSKRISASMSQIFKEQSPEAQEKKLEKFRTTLNKYKPYIQEVKKVLNEKDSDENR